jgi:chromate reductase
MKDILCLSGSLRAASSSRAVLTALRGRLEGRIRTRSFDIARLPHYNADILDNPAVAELLAAIRDADGLLIVTPEYNYSIPGVLKNAIDWASRPAYASVFLGKPVFIVSTSGGAMGGVRAQAHLKYIMNGMLARVFVGREVVAATANQKTVDGIFRDDAVLDFAAAEFDRFLLEF